MCIIAISPAGSPLPDEDAIAQMWASNPDGAGIMYAARGVVHVEKGFMHRKALRRYLKRLRREIDTTAAPVVLHFRIATAGSITPENTHPFPIAATVDALRNLSYTAPTAIAHNGIIPVTPRDKTLSDTQEYILATLHHLAAALPAWYADPNAMQMVANQTKSKLVILTGDGQLYTIGTFFDEADGLKYSNFSYEPDRPLWTPRAYAGLWARPVVIDDEEDDDDAPEDYYTEAGEYLVWCDPTTEYIAHDDGSIEEAYDYLVDEQDALWKYDPVGEDFAPARQGARLVATSDKATTFDAFANDEFRLLTR